MSEMPDGMTVDSVGCLTTGLERLLPLAANAVPEENGCSKRRGAASLASHAPPANHAYRKRRSLQRTRYTLDDQSQHPQQQTRLGKRNKHTKTSASDTGSPSSAAADFKASAAKILLLPLSFGGIVRKEPPKRMGCPQKKPLDDCFLSFFEDCRFRCFFVFFLFFDFEEQQKTAKTQRQRYTRFDFEGKATHVPVDQRGRPK